MRHEPESVRFVEEGVSRSSDSLVESQQALKGLDPKTKQLINIAIQTSIGDPRGVKFQAMMVKKGGASMSEVLGTVVMNVRLAGLAVVRGFPPVVD